MYQPTFDKHIDFNEEKTAIIDFCNKYWIVKENKEEFSLFVDFLFDFGVKLANNRFNAMEIGEVMRDITREEMKKMKTSSDKKEFNEKDFDNYDKKSKLSYMVGDLESYLNVQELYDYDTYMKKLLKEVKINFPMIKNIKPVDWKRYLTNPVEVEGEMYSKIQDFKGSKSSVGMYVWLNFADANTLSTIEYHNERGRKPLEALASSIVNQAYASEIHNNTVDMKQELQNLISAGHLDNMTLLSISDNIQSKPLKVLFEAASCDNEDDKDLKNSIFAQLKEAAIIKKKNKI